MKKLYQIICCILLICTSFLFYSCPDVLEELSSTTDPTSDPTTNPTTPTTEPSTPTTPVVVPVDLFTEEKNPEPYSSRTENLNFIFNNEKLATTTIRIKQSEWNTLLSNYDANSRNENYVHADFQFAQDSTTWTLLDCGFRLRGNTSRIRPQNEAGEYQQSHFKVDFEEFLTDDEERKMSGCMKGIILKRFKDDPTYVREVYGYDLFRRNNIWISPRAGYTKLVIQIVDDVNNGDTKSINYGVYATVEEINKQFLKERAADNQLTNNKGDLWKCTYAKQGASFESSHATDDTLFGVEEISLNEDDSDRFDYDLKTNEDELSTATTTFQSFISELNALDTSTDEDIAATKAWFEENMDIDLFLRTYAINVTLGMWDDYWGNMNNFYFYFDEGGKAYFIPYDYDNILGVSCSGICDDAGTKNPLEWGPLDDTRPLMQKIMAVPDFLSKYKEYLLEYSDSDSYFDAASSKTRIQKWQNMVKDYIACDTNTEGAYHELDDFPATWSPTNFYKLLSGGLGTNFFTTRQKIIKAAYDGETLTTTITFDANGGEFNFDITNYTLELEPDINLNDYVCTKSGSIFSCWKDEDGNVVNVSGFDDLSLKATYIESDDWVYSFDDTDNPTEITFKFDPTNFDFENFWYGDKDNNWVENKTNNNYQIEDIKKVFLAGDFNWNSPLDEVYAKHDTFTKQADGTYTYTVNLGEANVKYDTNIGIGDVFKFVVIFDEDKLYHDWFGADDEKYNYPVSVTYKSTDDNDESFVIKLY